MADENRYPFLHSHIAREAHIFEVLDEIRVYQEQALKGGNVSLATLETLRNSKNIKIPFTPGRNKNISYLLDLLIKNYPKEVRTIGSFHFLYDEAAKKLDVEEIIEFTLLIRLEDYNKLLRTRDDESIESILSLVKKFRLFNLTKLLARVKNNKELVRLIKIASGNSLFIHKAYSADKDTPDQFEELCFHRDNYDAVKRTVRIDVVQSIIAEHEEPVKRRLKRYGILTPTVTDYRDSKLDYVLNILLDELQGSLSVRDAAEIKSFKSLRECLIKVDSIIDPALIKSSDITSRIKEQRLIRASELTGLVEDLDAEILGKWTSDIMDKKMITAAPDATGTTCYFINNQFSTLLEEYYTLIFRNKEKFSSMEGTAKQKARNNLEFLYGIAQALLNGTMNGTAILNTDDKKRELEDIIKLVDEEYRRQSSTAAASQTPIERKEPVMVRIINFFRSFFSRSADDEPQAGGSAAAVSTRRKKGVISKETQNVYQQIQGKNGPLLALSDFIDITENSSTDVTRLINELRAAGLKIVIPIYGARKSIYPVRSSKYLMPDVEYLLAPPDVADSMEAMNRYIDLITGTKLKDEVLPVLGIIAIEKYLTTEYRQNRKKKKK